MARQLQVTKKETFERTICSCPVLLLIIYSIYQVKIEPGTTATTSQPKTGVPATASQATVIPASMLTVSALPSMDETVASTQQPLITPLKRKHEDEDDDYDS